MKRLLLFLALLVAPAQAQQPAVTIDGRPLPASAVVALQGEDATVRATAFLRACGAVIEGGGGFLEAWFPGGILSLSAGSAGYQWNAMPGRLSAPLQVAPDGAILASARQLAGILGLSQTAPLQFSTAGSAVLSGRQGTMPGSAAPEAPGLLQVPLDTPFSDGMTFLPESEGQGLPVTAANPDAAPQPLPQGPGQGPAHLALASFTARRDLQGTFSTWILQAVLQNDGGQDLQSPVELQFVVDGEVLDSDLVRALPAGTSVTWTKGAGLDPSTDQAAPHFRVLLISGSPGGPPVVLDSRDAILEQGP